MHRLQVIFYPFQFKKTGYLLFILLAILSCAKEDEKANLAPNSFQITVSDISANSASITWTKSIDPEGGKVVYAVYVNTILIIENISENAYSLTNLNAGTDYTIKVVASDNQSNTTGQLDNFTTIQQSDNDNLSVVVESEDYTNASISWSLDLTNIENLNFDLYLSNELVINGGSAQFNKYDFYGLENDTEYSGKVVAKSGSTVLSEKDFNFKTLFNVPPTPFTISLTETRFFAFEIDVEPSSDPDNTGNLNYQLFIDDVNVSEELYGSNVNIGAGSQLHNNLEGGTTYHVKVRARDLNGGETFSNTLEITTNTSPPKSFTLSASTFENVSYQRIVVPSFEDSVYDGYYYLDGVKYSLSGVYGGFFDDGSRFFDFATDNVPETNKTYKIELELVWTISSLGDTYTSKSDNQDLYLRKNEYTDTSADIESVTVYGPDHTLLPLQFVVKFKDGFISELEVFDIDQFVVAEFIKTNFLINGLGAPNKVSLSGTITQEEFDVIQSDTLPLSWVRTVDDNGYHLLEHNTVIIN